jgi:hypothetical protein
VDDSTTQAVLDAARGDLARVLAAVAEGGDLADAERAAREGVLAVGARLLEAGLAARGAGKAGPRAPCPCGGAAGFEGYRPKAVQTLVGWVTLRRAYYACPACGRGPCPLDAALGLERDGHSPGVRRLAAEFGARLPFAPAAARLPFAPAAARLAEAAGVRLSAGTVRATTEAAGSRREAQVQAAVAAAWERGLPPASGPAPERLYVALDGVRILGADGEGREVKVGVVQPARRDGRGERRAAASYAAGLEPAAAFGRRLALEAHGRGLEGAEEVVVLGDGAAWIWNLAAEHFPGATEIVDWYHASERVWTLGKALHGDGPAEAAGWVDGQLARLADGEVEALVAEWRALPCQGAAAAARDEQAGYFANQAGRMAYDRYRAAGLDIGSGLVEGACKHLIGAREKGPGMRWGEAGANAVAQVRVALFNDRRDELWAAA